MNWKRWITALILIPPLVLMILKSGVVLFTILIIAIGTLCLWEFFQVAFKEHAPCVPIIFPLWGYGCGALIALGAGINNVQIMIVLLAGSLIGAAMISVFRFKNNQDAPLLALKLTFGVFYISFFLSFLILIRNSDNGPWWVLFLFWVIGWGDTGALYAGTLWGRHKLCPSVSPKKTVEGAIGGLAANLIFAWLFNAVIFDLLSIAECSVFALIIGVVGQFGDLFESEFKRAAGVKDSSALLPGHGGFWDRLDALLLSAPVAFFLKEYLL